VPDLLGLVLKCGEINLRALEILDAAHTETYGHTGAEQRCPGDEAGEGTFSFPATT
jgi:hydroxylamine reductase (hybrid-cluster protein)